MPQLNHRKCSLLAPLLLLLLPFQETEATRYHGYTEKFGEPTDGGSVITASFFGGKGNEWLAAGDFAPDGTIILAGNIIGPGLEFPGVKFSVIGKDTPPPPEVERIPELDGKGRQRTHKDGSPRWETPSWRHQHVTGFVLRCSPDLKSVLSAHRLPWSSGAITDCKVGKDGTIYLTGKATEKITAFHPEARELASPENGMETSACDHTFVAALTADAMKVSWLNHCKGPSNAPKLSWTKQGQLRLAAQAIQTFAPDGKLQQSTVVQGGLGHLVAVNPNDGTYARGGEHHSRTGREPWRCPTLNIYKPDGSKLYHLYDWLGPYVGLDNSRLVSDTAVRRVSFDPDGYMLVYLWSDGGNSVALRDPIDVRRLSPEINGLGFSAWGAGVLSCAYLVKIDTRSYRAVGGTMWLAYQEEKEKPNSAWIDSLGHLPDGSVCFTGRAASSIIQTTNRLSDCQYGHHVVVLNDNLSHIRFSSSVPGGGAIQVGDDRETWGIASTATSGNKQRVLFLTGSKGADDEFQTPTVNALQDGFGGGWSDGYALLVEFDKNPPSPPGVADAVSPESTDWEIVDTKADIPTFLDKKGRGPAAGQVFKFQPETPKWITIDAEFCSADEDVWPSFLYGRPIGGSFTFDPQNPKAEFSWSLDHIAQRSGDQSRRVLGEIVPAGGDSKTPTGVRFELKSLGAMKAVKEERMEKGKKKSRTRVFAIAEGVLHIGGQNYKIQPTCTFTFKMPRDGQQADRVQFDAEFETTGSAIGLKSPAAKGPIEVRISGVGYTAD